jgi:PAS domain S-box-containing protein
MRDRLRSTVTGYVVAVAATAAVVLLRWLLDPWMGYYLPFITLYGAVAAAVWYGGYRPALIATAVGYLACNYLFMEPRGSLTLLHSHHYIGLVLYLFTCSLIIGFGELMQLAQRRTQEGQELLRVTFTSMGDAVITTDSEGRVTSLNQVAGALTGWTQDEAARRPLEEVFRIVNEHTRQPVENPVKKVLAEGKVIGLANHTVLVAKDGSERPIDDSAAPIRDAGGVLRGVVLIFRDITERRKAEAARRQLAVIVESSEDAIISRDVDGLITSWNRGAERLYGHTAEEVIGRPVSILVPSDQSDELPGIMERLKRGERIERYETVRVHKDGRRVEVSLSASPMKNGSGRMLGASFIAQDITARRRAEAEVGRLNKELQSRVEELQSVLKVLPVGLAIAHDPACHGMTLNPYMSDLLGVSVGANASLSAPPDERPDCYTNYRDGEEVPPDQLPMQVACTGVEVRDFEVDLVRAGRDTLRLLCYARPLLDNEGQVRGSVGAFLDITELKRVEEALREADHRKDEFLATLAHELRNPLAPIRNALELLRRGDHDATLIEQARRMMERQVGHMVRLVDDLLDISRITRGKLQLRKERVELADVLHTAIETARPLLEASAHELAVTMPPQPVPVQADPTRLAQVFANLLNNAAKYTEKAGHIWLTAERREGEAVVSVRDTGIGIAAEHLPDIFKMFSQVAPALERSQGGLGIGLSLVKGLVELHGGAIEARSAGPGKGSEFTVHLPIVDGPVEAPQEPTENAEKVRRVHKCRILVVDDLRDAADSLAIMLRTMGHDTRTAYDGLEAVQTAAAFRPHVVLLDIGLPKMNGYEAARRIRNEPWGGDVALVAVTGWGQEEDKRRSLEAGFDHHLTKPVEAAALEKLLALLMPQH